MGSYQQPRRVYAQTGRSLAWSRQQDSNVVQLYRKRQFPVVALGSCSYHDAALAEEAARPRK